MRPGLILHRGNEGNCLHALVPLSLALVECKIALVPLSFKNNEIYRPATPLPKVQLDPQAIDNTK